MPAAQAGCERLRAPPRQLHLATTALLLHTGAHRERARAHNDAFHGGRRIDTEHRQFRVLKPQSAS